MKKTDNTGLVLFAYGFRPFFLLAGLYAVIAVAVWLWMFTANETWLHGMALRFWHGHEMVFGFIGAAIAGFLLTAVPNWTGRRAVAGPPLMLLTILWLAGRVAFASAGVAPWGVIALAELAFVPALMLTVGASLFRAANRNTPLLFVLFAFWISDAVFVYGSATGDVTLQAGALRAGLDIVLLLITAIGGRIVPAFTGNALKAGGVAVTMRSRPVVERTVMPLMLAYAISDILAPFGWITAIVAALAGLAQFWRLAGWHGLKTVAQPIVWILHVAYLWLPIGLMMKAVHIGLGVAWPAFWQHALGAGAAAMMIMAVMTRASLGHTGRALRVSRWITVAYLLLAASVALRVFGPALLPLAYRHTIIVSGALWVLSFAVFVVVYTPILLGPRVDGKPG